MRTNYDLPTTDPAVAGKVRAFTYSGASQRYGGDTRYLETDWQWFSTVFNEKNKTLSDFDWSFARCWYLDIVSHLRKSPMADFTDLSDLKRKMAARLPQDTAQRPKRKRRADWMGSDLNLNPIINRRGIPFERQYKKRLPRPVVVIAQRLANVSTSGGIHQWNGVQGLWLTEYLEQRGYDVEFHAYSDHRQGDRVLTSVKLKGAGERLYPEILRRALCDQKIYTGSWWPYRSLSSLSEDTCLGSYGHNSDKETMAGFTWAEGRKVIVLDLAYNEADCIRHLTQVLDGDPGMVYDFTQGVAQ